MINTESAIGQNNDPHVGHCNQLPPIITLIPSLPLLPPEQTCNLHPPANRRLDNNPLFSFGLARL